MAIGKISAVNVEGNRQAGFKEGETIPSKGSDVFEFGVSQKRWRTDERLVRFSQNAERFVQRTPKKGSLSPVEKLQMLEAESWEFGIFTCSCGNTCGVSGSGCCD